jgi:hypothetical protein
MSVTDRNLYEMSCEEINKLYNLNNKNHILEIPLFWKIWTQTYDNHRLEEALLYCIKFNNKKIVEALIIAGAPITYLTLLNAIKFNNKHSRYIIPYLDPHKFTKFDKKQITDICKDKQIINWLDQEIDILIQPNKRLRK